VKNWLHNNPGTIVEEEVAFIEKDGDIVSLITRPKSPLRRLIERFPTLRAWAIFRAKPRSTHVTSSTTIYHSTGAVEIAVFVIVVVGALFLFVGSMWALQFIQDSITKLSIITAFILAFTAPLSCATVIKPFEVLAATAA